MRTNVAPGDVGLTFDDGPDPAWTERLLSVLDGRRAPATFFVQGSAVRRYPELTEKIVASSHEVALHCFEHRRHSEMTPDQIRSDVEAGLAALDRLDIRPRAWRTPWGVGSPTTAAIAAEFDLELWRWSSDTHDWRGDRWERMLEVLTDAGLTTGEVILMHDGLGPGARRTGCWETLRLTEALLDLTQSEGLCPTTLSGALSRSGG